jgi:hypothetical protein
MAKITGDQFARIKAQLKIAVTPAQFNELFNFICLFDLDKNTLSLASYYNGYVEKLKINALGLVRIFDLYDMQIDMNLNQAANLVAQYRQSLAGRLDFFNSSSIMFDQYKELAGELSTNETHPKHLEHCKKFYDTLYTPLLSFHLKLRYHQPKFIAQFENPEDSDRAVNDAPTL